MSNELDHEALLNQKASEWMHQGIDLLDDPSPIALERAVRCFDEAIALRQLLSLEKNPRHLYGLAAGWMNRGDALARLGGTEQLTASVISYDEALHHLLRLPLKDDPVYPRRLAIAWINRGFVRQKEATATSQDDAVRCFREALAVLESSAALAINDHNLLRAGALTNLAGALPDLPDFSPVEARASAQEAMNLVKDMEQIDPTAAETGFKARHALCRAIATEARDEKIISPTLIVTATEAVDSGLALARQWEQRSDYRFRNLAEDLFRFGCRIYQIGQPDHVAKFILENLDPEKRQGVPPLNPLLHGSAVDALWGTLKEMQRDGFASLDTPRFAPLLKNVRELRVAEERLEHLRQGMPLV